MTDSVPTAAALVTAGREMFGRRGFDGASVRAITRRAGANLGAVTYHFGSKDALYRAVVASALEPLAAGIGEVAAQPGSPLDRLEWCVRLCLGYVAENPEVPRLLVDRPEGDDPDPGSEDGALERILATLAGLIEEGQAAGAIRAGDPALLAASVLAQPIQTNLTPGGVAGPTVRRWLAADPDDLAENTIAFVLAGLRADTADRAGVSGQGGGGRGRSGRAKRRRR